MAQLGSALVLGTRGRRFKSCLTDHLCFFSIWRLSLVQRFIVLNLQLANWNKEHYRASQLGPDSSICVYVFINSHINRFRTTVVGVAQLVEPRIVIPVVVGSSPIVHPTFSGSGGIGRHAGFRFQCFTAWEFKSLLPHHIFKLYQKLNVSIPVGEWRSLVAHLFWVQGVAGSNPVSPTIYAFFDSVNTSSQEW